MTSSDAFPFTLKGEPAFMYVVHNDGFCWGRIVTARGVELDVSTQHDYYDYDDDTAAQAFIRKAKRGGTEEPMGWTGCFAQPAKE